MFDFAISVSFLDIAAVITDVKVHFHKNTPCQPVASWFGAWLALSKDNKTFLASGACMSQSVACLIPVTEVESFNLGRSADNK